MVFQMIYQKIKKTMVRHDAMHESYRVNSDDKSSILNINNVDILASINNNALSNDFYTNAGIDLKRCQFNRSCPRYIKY